MATSLGATVAKKKANDKEPVKRYGTLIRVSDDFAESVRKACALEGKSAAEFIDDNLLVAVKDKYRLLLSDESKKMGGKGGG